MQVQAICRNTCWEFVGALLCPHGEALGYMVRKGLAVQDVLTAAKNAGKELARAGKIIEENLKIVSQELVPLETYVETTNRGFKRALARFARS